jgi:hypoxanthine phosphoribosyltransferase
MNFRAYEDLLRDLEKWEKELPEFDAVCGVPRSGLLAASYLATRRNIRLVSIDKLVGAESPESAIINAPLRDNNPLVRFGHPIGNRLLIVDDTSSKESVTMRLIRSQLADCKDLEITYGAVYQESEESAVDVYYETVAKPRLFEWNWQRHSMLQRAMFDMDGVLCEDWTARQEMDDDPEFLDHVCNAKPLFLPAYPIRAITTSRIERYRAETVAWLAKHKVKYQVLNMHPAATPEARRAARDHSYRKAQHYIKDSDSSTKGSQLFVESDSKQARAISGLARGKPVLCTDNMVMYLDGKMHLSDRSCD